MKTINLYLPITSQPRELDSKMLLAMFARERGLNPLFGYKSAFQARLGSLPPGIFLAHNARQKSENLDRVKKFGHRVLVLDEEALVRQSDEIFLRKHPKDAFDHVDHILTWGEDDRSLWDRSGFDLHCDVTVVGNPRIDMLRRELQPIHAASVVDIRNRFGRYVLLNTNFPTVNNLTPQGGGVRLADWGREGDGKQVEQDFLRNKREMFEKMLEIVPQLAAAVAPLSLVIRPHPNEDHEPWKRAVSGISNAHTVFEGGVVPWLIGSSALIHNNCTTGVEAAVIGTPILNFRPWQSKFDNPLSHAFGVDCPDVESLASALRNIVAGKDPGLSAEQKKLLERHIASVTGPFSCQRIVDLVAASGQSLQERDESLLDRNKKRLALKWLWIKRYIRWYVSSRGRKKRRFLRERYPGIKIHKLDFGQLRYSEQQFDLLMRQFPPLTTADIDERINGYSDALNKFKGFRSATLANNLFTIVR